MIYIITNTVTKDTYIGKTINSIKRRWRGHCYSANYGSETHLHRAIRKYGVHSFIVEELDNDYEDINVAEKYWIAKLSPSYNMTDGGDGGWINDQTGNTWKVKDTSNMGEYFRSGRVHKSENWINATTGGNNYQCDYIITTPWGDFETWKDATETARFLRQQGRKDVITDGKTLKKYCLENIKLNPEGRRTLPEWRGKHTQEIGFGYRKK